MKKTKKTFKKELEELLNKYSIDNDCKTPDYIIAEYLCDCICGYKKTIDAMRKREEINALPPKTNISHMVGE